MSAPERIGAFPVVRRVGQGGMGAVFEVRDPRSERTLALKLILETQATPTARARFFREAEVLARVRHRGVVRIHELGRAAQGPYLLQELVEGADLAARAARQPFTPREAAEVVRHLADAVAAIHAQGVLHRDLKPRNVILRPDGIPVLLDFGLARDMDAETLTATGTLLGSPAYLSPEQAGGVTRELTAATDVYGLGAILFFLLSGRDPFRGASVLSVVRQVSRDEPAWPSADHPETPWELEAICRLAMAKAPSARYPSAAALRDDLDRYLQGAPTRARVRVAPPRPGRRRAWRLAAGAAALAAAGTLAALVASPAGAPEAPSPSAPPPDDPPPARASAPPTEATLPLRLPLERGGPALLALPPPPRRAVGEKPLARWLDDEHLVLGVERDRVRCLRVDDGQERWAARGRLLGVDARRGEVYVTADGGLDALRAADGARATSLAPPLSTIRAVAAHPAAPLLAVVGDMGPGGGLVVLRAPGSGELLEQVELSPDATAGRVAFSHDGALLAAGTIQTGGLGKRHLVKRFSVAPTGRLTQVGPALEGTYAITALAFAPRRPDLLVATKGGQVLLLRSGAAEPVALAGGHEDDLLVGATAHRQSAESLAFLPDGRLVSVSGETTGLGQAGGEVRVWSAGSYQQLEQFDGWDALTGVDVGIGAERLALVARSGRLEVRAVRR